MVHVVGIKEDPGKVDGIDHGLKTQFGGTLLYLLEVKKQED